MDRERRAELDGLLTRMGSKPPPAFDEPEQILAELTRRGAPHYRLRPDMPRFVADFSRMLNKDRTARQFPSPSDLFRIATVPKCELGWLRLRTSRLMNGLSHAELSSRLARKGVVLDKPQLCWRETNPTSPKGRSVPLGADVVPIAECLGVRPEWLSTGEWTDVPIAKHDSEYSLADAAKIVGIQDEHPELKLKDIVGVVVTISADTEIPTVIISDNVYFDRAVQLGFARRDDFKGIKSFHDSIALTSKARQDVLAHTIGYKQPQQATWTIPEWLLIYAVCVQHAWRVVRDVEQGLRISKEYRGMALPSLEHATASRWINLYFSEAIEPALGNFKKSIEKDQSVAWLYRRGHGFIHLFPSVYPFMHEAGKCPTDEYLNVDFIDGES